MSLVPGMVEEVEVFRSILEEYAKNGEIIYLKEASLNLTIDIIGRIIMWRNSGRMVRRYTHH